MRAEGSAQFRAHGQRTSFVARAGAAEMDVLREDMRRLMREHGVSLRDLSEAAGYGRGNSSRIGDVLRGRKGMYRGSYLRLRAAVDRFPTGWRIHGGNGDAERAVLESASAADGMIESMGERNRREAFERSEAMRAARDERGVPSPLNRAAWEAYWLAREKPAINGRKYRATPLSRQVA